MRVTLKADGLDLFWSLRMPQALPADLRARGERFARVATPWLDMEMALILGLFAAAMLAGLWRRDAAILVVGGCAILKILLQALLSPMPRLLVPATAMELLAIALGFGLFSEIEKRPRGALLAVAVAVPALFAILQPPLSRVVEKMDREEMERRGMSAAAVVPSPRPSPAGRGRRPSPRPSPGGRGGGDGGLDLVVV
jgi:hypothetical protein